MLVPAAIVVSFVIGACVADVIAVVLSAIETPCASTSHSSASAISSSLAPPAPPSGALALRLRSVLFALEVGPQVCMVSPTISLLLLIHASLVASTFFEHLLLNAVWFPLQLGHFYFVWPP